MPSDQPAPLHLFIWAPNLQPAPFPPHQCLPLKSRAFKTQGSASLEATENLQRGSQEPRPEVLASGEWYSFQILLQLL